MFGSFGAQNTTNSAAPGTGLFGQQQNQQNQQQQQQPSTGLFGSTTQNQQAPSMFGTQQNTQQSQPSLFGGASTTNATTGGSLFGNTNQTQNTGTNAFGQPQQQQGTTGGGLFGSTATQPTSNLFGNTTTTNTRTGLFGAATTNQQQQPNGGLFGNTQQNQQQQQQQPQQNQPTGLFGSTAFGANKPAGSLFGSTTQPTNAGTGLFGSQMPNVQNQQSPMFGGGNASTLGSSALGVSSLGTSSLLPTRGPLTNAQADPQTQFMQLAHRIEASARAWDTSSPDCRFQHYFYNLVDPNQIHLYTRPPNATNEALWQKAVRENPDPKCLVPVLAVGFDDLRTRVEAQTQQASAHQERLKELKDRLNALTQRHAVSNASRLSRAASVQRQITHRLLTFIQHLHLLIPTLRSSALSGEEEQLRMKLEGIEEDIRRGRAQSRLNELWGLVGAVNAARGRNSGGNNGGEWTVVDEGGLAQLSKILMDEQNGLAHLTSIIQKDLKDLGVIMGTDTEPSEHMSSSSNNTLRGSVFR